jgi:hypothetical protein
MKEMDNRFIHDKTLFGGYTHARIIPETKRFETQIEDEKHIFSSVGGAKKYYDRLYRNSRRWALVGLHVAAGTAAEYLFFTPPDSPMKPLEGALAIWGLVVALKRGHEVAVNGQILREVKAFDLRELPSHEIDMDKKTQKESDRLVKNLSSTSLSPYIVPVNAGN